MALRLGKCSRVSIHYRFRPVYHQLCTINCSSPWPIHPGRGISELLKLGVADTLVDYRQPGSPGTRTDMEVSMATIISYAPHHCCPEPKWHPTSSKNFNRMNADWPPLRYEHSDMSTLRTGSLVSASSKWLDRSHKFIFRLHKGSPLASGFRVRLEAMWFKGVFDWDPLPQSSMENGFLGQKGMGEGRCGWLSWPCKSQPVDTCLRAKGYLSMSLAFKGEMQEGKWQKKQNPESKENEWILKLTNLLCVSFQEVSGGEEGRVWSGRPVPGVSPGRHGVSVYRNQVKKN